MKIEQKAGESKDEFIMRLMLSRIDELNEEVHKDIERSQNEDDLEMRAYYSAAVDSGLATLECLYYSSIILKLVIELKTNSKSGTSIDIDEMITVIKNLKAKEPVINWMERKLKDESKTTED